VFLDQGRVTLDLIYQDSKTMLASSDFAADIWFLDGFTPIRNPDMWHGDIYHHMARCSAKDAICASFTAAGDVRRGLEAAGFDITRHDGFGRKRHRITGILSSRIAVKPQPALPASVKIIGAGIAGASLAYALARRHINVEVLDAASDMAEGASGNIAALQTPRLTVDPTDHGWLSMNAFGFARRSALAMGAGLDKGCITLAKDEKEAMRQQKLLRQGWPDALFSHMDAAAISDRLGVHLAAEGLFYPYAGAVDPRLWISRLLENIPCRYNVNITSMTNTASGIMLTGDYGHKDHADIVVIAAGAGLSALWGPRMEPILPITANCGQVSHIPSDDAPDITIPISFGGYMARSKDGSVVLGASYQRIQNDHIRMPADQISAHANVYANVHAENIARLPDTLQNRLPHAPDHWQNHWGGRQSVRATTPDRQPMAGALGKELYILGGLGSRGMVTAPILAEALAADICGEASPLDTAMRRAVDPFRFSRRAGL
jgi:tRNA 5-methylaminomethyl-2-thiouridine biosynthesis bifunctional protein